MVSDFDYGCLKCIEQQIVVVDNVVGGCECGACTVLRFEYEARDYFLDHIFKHEVNSFAIVPGFGNIGNICVNRIELYLCHLPGMFGVSI